MNKAAYKGHLERTELSVHNLISARQKSSNTHPTVENWHKAQDKDGEGNGHLKNLKTCHVTN